MTDTLKYVGILLAFVILITIAEFFILIHKPACRTCDGGFCIKSLPTER